MIIIPSIETILIQPLRTGTTSLRDAVLKHYPDAWHLYRHAERSLVPHGYEKFKVVCQFRRPEDRLRSLWRYMRAPSSTSGRMDTVWEKEVKDDADMRFDVWLWANKHPFVTGNHNHPDKLNAHYTMKHYGPIARRPIQVWARPDLGQVNFFNIRSQIAINEFFGADVAHDIVPNNESRSFYDEGDRSEIMKFLHQYHFADMEIQNKLSGYEYLVYG